MNKVEPADIATSYRNVLITGISLGIAFSLFISSQFTQNPNFSDLEANTISFDLSSENGKPTIVEFYAKW